MVHVSHHLWTLISLSPTWCLPRLLRCHWLPSFSWLSADQVHSSWLVSLHPCACPFHLAPGILSVQLLPKRENSWRTRGIAPSSVWAWAPQPKSSWTLGKWFFDGIPWWIVEWYSLSGSVVDHTIEWSIEWSHIIALLESIFLKSIFQKQNLCHLNTCYFDEFYP